MSELPSIATSHPHVLLDARVLDGSPIVRGTRVPVRRLWAWFQKGVTVEALIKRYPSLGPARILSALAFACDNRELMTADLAREQALLEGDRVPFSKTQLELLPLDGSKIGP